MAGCGFQYLFISLAEILVCVTALELAYMDSPPHLKGSVTSIWCIVQALGNLLDVILFLALQDLAPWIVFYTFTALMFLSCILFIFIARRYRRERALDVGRAVDEVLSPLRNECA